MDVYICAVKSWCVRCGCVDNCDVKMCSITSISHYAINGAWRRGAEKQSYVES